MGLLDGVFEKTGAVTPDGGPVYASRLVGTLELMRCENRWRIAYAHDEASPCDPAATVLGATPCVEALRRASKRRPLGYVGSPDLSERASVFSNRDAAGCTGEPWRAVSKIPRRASGGDC